MQINRKIFYTILLLSSLHIFAYTGDTLMLEMRDTVELETFIYQPDTYTPPWGTILQRTPYGNQWGSQEIDYVTDIRGYVLVVQNLRGCGNSQGEPMLFLTDGWGELQDGYDTIEWIASQSWSDGKIGMFGSSAHGMTQYFAAGALPPHLTCCVPIAAGPSLYHHSSFTGGEFRKALTETWLQNMGTPWLIDSVCNHPDYDSLWSVVNLKERYDSTDYPMFHISGWHDLYTDGQLEAFENLNTEFGNQKLLIGPWTHGNWGSRYQGDLVYPENSEMSENEFFLLVLDWYDFWMKNDSNGITEPVVKYYLMGNCDTQDTTNWNHWVTSNTWPPEDVEYEKYYLIKGGSLDTLPPAQVTCTDSFTYNPANPCTTYGGREYIGLSNGYGPIDQRPIENRSDVLVYSTPELDSALTVIGKLKMTLFASSDCYDTDWTVRITDVYPDGRSILVTDGILMARHRNGFDTQDSLIPGVVDTFLIDLWSTAWVFDQGHRLRAIISSSNYPRFEKNPNTGAPFERDDSVTLEANQQVHLSSTYKSHLLLPVKSSGSGIEKEHLTGEDNRIKVKSRLKPFTINLELKGERKVNIELYDVTGRKLWSIKNNNLSSGNHKFRINSLSAGIYFIHSKIDDVRCVKKTFIIK